MSIELVDSAAEGNARPPHSHAYTRNHALTLPTTRLRGHRDQDIRDSILDSIWIKLRYRKKPLSPDSFETFLRGLKEVTLADIYHNLNEQPASYLQSLFWFVSSLPATSSGVFTPLISNEPLAKQSVSDFFDQVYRVIQDVKPNSTRLCCMTRTAPDIRQLFSYFRLFSLSAYSEPQFWARHLLVHLLLWSQFVSQSFADILVQNTIVKDDAGKEGVFRLPSQGAPTTSSWDFVYMWPYDVVAFNVVDIHTRRPYKLAPSLEKIESYISTRENNSYDLTLLFDSTRALERFKLLINTTINPTTTTASSTPLGSVYNVIFAIHQQMNEESLRFLEIVLKRSSEMAKSLEELKQSQIAGIMSFLVATYVPVAFVSSYFGMNTDEILNGDMHNSTFWKIAIPLMALTIMLPLSLTIMARVARGMSLSASAFSLRQWPMIVDLFITFFLISILVAHIVHWRTSGDSNFAVFFTRISSSETLIVDCLFACFFLLKAVENSILRNRRGRLWFYYFLTISLVAALCAGFSVLDHSLATLLAPLAFTLLALAARPLLF
ncbi:hypothetical protein MMC27_008532 [Xylographa pallens]|nr:hypothetical protein [Xylographa pallens]